MSTENEKDEDRNEEVNSETNGEAINVEGGEEEEFHDESDREMTQEEKQVSFIT